MTSLRLAIWQAVPSAKAVRSANVRALAPLRPTAETAVVSGRSLKFLMLVIVAHAAVFWLLHNTTHSLEPPQVQSAPMLVSLIAEPAPQPIAIEKPMAEQPKPVAKPQSPQMIPKKVAVKQTKPEPQPAAIEPDPMPPSPLEIQETIPPEATQQMRAEEASATPAPQIAKVEQAATPQPRQPVVEPPRFGVAYLKNPPPEYPAVSRRMGEEGRVVLRVLVTAEGKPETVEIENGSGSRRLDSAALDAVKKWKFIPAKRDNEPVSAFVLVPLKFALNG